MLRSVFFKSIWEQRRALLWWGLGMIVLTVVTMAFYPSVRDAPGLLEIMEQLPEALRKAFMGDIVDLRSAEGYLNSQLFIMLFPLLFLVYAIRLGGSVAGEEESGTLDLLLSCPLPRARLVLEKAWAMAVGTAFFTVATWLGLLAGIAAVDMNISILRTAEAVFSGLLLALAFGALALAMGCGSGKKALAAAIPAGVAVAGYFLNALAPLVEGLEPYRRLSPFYYYYGADPLSNGLNIAHAGVLLGLTVVLIAIAVLLFQRRDLGT